MESKDEKEVTPGTTNPGEMEPIPTKEAEPAAEENRFSLKETSASSSSISSDYCRPSTSRNALEAQRTSAQSKSRNDPTKTEESKSFYFLSELMHREHGLFTDGWRSFCHRNSNGFEKRYSGSHLVVKKFRKMHSIYPGNGSLQAKALHFNKVGQLLCSTSPARIANTVQVWDWASEKLKYKYKAGCGITQISDLKFVEANNSMSIVTAHVHGEGILATIPPSGGEIKTRQLYKRNSSLCKLALCPHNPFLVVSAALSGQITMCDIRSSPNETCLKTIEGEKCLAKLFSIEYHPVDDELCLGCSDNYVRVYDVRRLSKPIYKMCPQKFIDGNYDCLMCTAVYDATGSEILGSYSYEGNYLFNNQAYIPGSYIRGYSGHYSIIRRIKVGYASRAKFFGLNSEYVISSSDFGSICFWNKNTGKLICIIGEVIGEEYFEPHPSLPVIASCRSEPNNTINIWAPLDKKFKFDKNKTTEIEFKKN